MAASEYNATVSQRVEITPGLIILRVVPDGRLFDFEAGQYSVLGLRRSDPRVREADPEETEGSPDKIIKRAYSIASSSKAEEYIEFYVTLVPSGELTPRLFHLKAKDRLFLGRKATGVFTLDGVPAGRHVLLVATGTGLAPYMSMLRTDLICGEDRRYVLLHGARYSWDLGYRTELISLDRLCPNVHYIPVVSRPGDDPTWKGRTGYVQDALFSGVAEEESGLAVTPENFHVFLCGNPAMITDAKARLIERGFEADVRGKVGTLHIEEYW